MYIANSHDAIVTCRRRMIEPEYICSVRDLYLCLSTAQVTKNSYDGIRPSDVMRLMQKISVLPKRLVGSCCAGIQPRFSPAGQSRPNDQ